MTQPIMYSPRPGSELERLIYTVFQRPAGGKGQANCVVFTSALPGEGVTHVVRQVGFELAKHQTKRTLIIDSRHLQTLVPEDLALIDGAVRGSSGERLCMVTMHGRKSETGPSSHWQSDPQFREDCVQELARYFDYILVDCSAISTCAAVVSLAPIADGVVLVVEAGRTKRNQIQFAEEFLRLANAKFLGYVLNKREYPIPQWLHARL